MRTPCLVDIDRYIVAVGDSHDGVDLGSDPPVRGRGEHHEPCRRMGVQGSGHRTRVGSQRHIEDRVNPRGDVNRPGAGEDECCEEGGMHIPGDDHLVSRVEQGEQGGVIAGGRAVGEEERPVGAPGERREGLRLLLDRVLIGGVEPDIGCQEIRADQGAKLLVNREPALMARCRERDRAGRSMVVQRLDDRGTMLKRGVPIQRQQGVGDVGEVKGVRDHGVSSLAAAGAERSAQPSAVLALGARIR